MNIKRIFRNPLDVIAEFWAERRQVPVDIMRVRSRYLFFLAFPGMFNREEYLHLFKAMLDMYIKSLDVVYSNYSLGIITMVGAIARSMVGWSVKRAHGRP